MADWKNLVIKLVLQDGVIDDNEVKVLKKELYADGVIDKKEVDFLIELKNTAKKPSPGFSKFFFKAIEDNVLKDGKIDTAEAKWLKKLLYADGKIDDEEKKFLQALKKKAKEVSPAFTALYDEATGVAKAEKPAEKPAAKPKKAEKAAPATPAKAEKAVAKPKKKAKAKKPAKPAVTDNGAAVQPVAEASKEASPASNSTPGT
jgi:uncharacterized tellurite resistance protein B-like protein